MTGRTRIFTAVAVVLAGLPVAALPADTASPDWLFPSRPVAPGAESPDAVVQVPGSSRHFTVRETRDIANPPDWFPQDHAAMPPPVGHATGKGVWACGYCHLPGGQGRPENARVAGLPRDYILRQLRAMVSGERRSLRDDYGPAKLMAAVPVGRSEAELAEAADYFAASRPPVRVELRPVARVPLTEVMGSIRRLAPGGGSEALGQRIIEVPVDFERHEWRDGRLAYLAFVPVGSVVRGRSLAARWGEHGAFACVTCHGAGLRGTAIAPPLAGQYPGYIVRQLAAFQGGTRHGGAAETMRQVTAGMTTPQMISLAAWAASLRP
ncbi:MAG: hypothetical protein KGN34_03305 [Sphingomonadales bacterium]|nr:hypothetical protein [Sphingomonadales bacterium]